MFDPQIDELNALMDTTWSCAPGAAVEAATDAVLALKHQTDVALLKMLIAYHESQQWALEGHFSVAAAIAHRHGVDRNELAALMSLAKKLRTMPGTWHALAEGKISVGHAKLLAKANRPTLADVFASPDGETFLISWALELSFADFKAVVHRWIEVNLDEDDERKKQDRLNRSDVKVSTDFDGDRRIEAKLPALVGAEVEAELKRLEKAEFQADWEAAKAEHGPDINLDMLARTPGQRRVDALGIMARRSSTYNGQRNPSPRYMVNVVMDHHTFDTIINQNFGDNTRTHNANRTLQTLDGQPISPDQALEAMIHGRMRKVVLAAESHKLQFGRSKRLFDGPLRDFIKIRDLRCTAPGCTVPADRCEVDHTIEWDDGGTTEPHNGKLRCKPHNLQKEHQRQRRRKQERSPSERGHKHQRLGDPDGDGDGDTDQPMR